MNLKYLKKEFTVTENELKTIINYRYTYNEHCTPLTATFYLYDENIIDTLESNVDLNVIRYKKATKKKKRAIQRID